MLTLHHSQFNCLSGHHIRSDQPAQPLTATAQSVSLACYCYCYYFGVCFCLFCQSPLGLQEGGYSARLSRPGLPKQSSHHLLWLAAHPAAVPCHPCFHHDTALFVNKPLVQCRQALNTSQKQTKLSRKFFSTGHLGSGPSSSSLTSNNQ